MVSVSRNHWVTNSHLWGNFVIHGFVYFCRTTLNKTFKFAKKKYFWICNYSPSFGNFSRRTLFRILDWTSYRGTHVIIRFISLIIICCRGVSCFVTDCSCSIYRSSIGKLSPVINRFCITILMIMGWDVMCPRHHWYKSMQRRLHTSQRTHGAIIT